MPPLPKLPTTKRHSDIRTFLHSHPHPLRVPRLRPDLPRPASGPASGLSDLCGFTPTGVGALREQSALPATALATLGPDVARSPCIYGLCLQICMPSEASSEMPPYLSFQLQNYILTFALSYILTLTLFASRVCAPTCPDQRRGRRRGFPTFAALPRPASGLGVSNPRVCPLPSVPSIPVKHDRSIALPEDWSIFPLWQRHVISM